VRLKGKATLGKARTGGVQITVEMDGSEHVFTVSLLASQLSATFYE